MNIKRRDFIRAGGMLAIAGVGIYGASSGNGFFRFWGFEVPRGLSIYVY